MKPDDTPDTPVDAQPQIGDGDLLPCSATQERCWFLDQMTPGTQALNVAFRWNVSGRFTVAGFAAAFRAVIARHEILRTRFVVVGGQPMQQVMPEAPFHLPEIDIRTTPKAEQEERIEEIALKSASIPFDLSRPGLIRATLIRQANDRAIIAITVHQICFDGWSIRILGREIGQLAAAYDSGTDLSLPPLPLQYGDFALWQREYFASPSFADDLVPWQKRLEGAPYFELQPDFPRPLVRSPACDMVKTDLPPAFGERLNAAAKARSMSPFAYGAGVLSALLAKAADSSEVLIGTQVAGRTEVDLEQMIGVFINNVVMRFPIAASETFAQHLDRAGKVVQDALAGQNVPFNKLVEMVNPPRDPSRTPLISINFTLQHVFMETARYGEFELSSAPSHAPGAIYDLNFVLIGRVSGWRMTLEYSTDLFDRDTADDLLALWQEAFRFAFEDDGRLLSEMPQPRLGSGARADNTRQLSKIEAALTSHPRVHEAAAVPYRGADGGRRIHAFVAPEATTPALPLETLPATLMEHLAESPVRPDGISVLLDLPHDGAGRVVRALLPLAVAARATRPPAPAPAAKDPVPLAGVEQRLAAIWCDLLGLESVAPTANFFDLGGHSLLTVRMLARIEREFGQRISLATAYHVPTLRALARHLAGDSAPAAAAATAGEGDWRVLALQEEGEGIPLIAINNAQTVYALSKAMAHPRPALAVRIFDKSRGIDLTPRPFEEIAADYVDAIRSAQPEGPYALFGICAHGNLAIEVARLLKAQGSEVATVILKDVWEPAYAQRISAARRTALLGRLHFLKVRLRFLMRGDISLSAFLGTFRLFRNSGLLNAAVRLRLIERVRNTDLDQEQEEFVNHLTEARNAHCPEPYDGTVLHFVTRESPSRRPFDPEMGWGQVVTGRLITRQLADMTASARGAAGIAEAAAEIEALLRATESTRGAGDAAAASGSGDQADSGDQANAQ